MLGNYYMLNLDFTTEFYNSHCLRCDLFKTRARFFKIQVGFWSFKSRLENCYLHLVVCDGSGRSCFFV